MEKLFRRPSSSMGCPGKRACTSPPNRPAPRAEPASGRGPWYTFTSRVPQEGERPLSRKPSTAERLSRKRRAKARIASLRSLPVAGWYRAICPSRRTTRIGSRGTPRPISSSGQTGWKSTQARSFSTKGSGSIRPLYRQAWKPRQALTTRRGRAKSGMVHLSAGHWACQWRAGSGTLAPCRGASAWSPAAAPGWDWPPPGGWPGWAPPCCWCRVIPGAGSAPPRRSAAAPAIPRCASWPATCPCSGRCAAWPARWRSATRSCTSWPTAPGTSPCGASSPRRESSAPWPWTTSATSCSPCACWGRFAPGPLPG